MSSPINYIPGFEAVHTLNDENALWQYLQSQSPETFQEVAQSSSSEVLEILGHNIRSIVGGLPPEQFGVQIVTNRESLAKLLSNAMMGGYMLRVMEQRHQLEKALAGQIKNGDTDADSENRSEAKE